MTVKIGLARVDIQERITIEALLDSKTTKLMVSTEFVRKHEFKLKRLEKPIYVGNMDIIFNIKDLIQHTVSISIFMKSIERE